MKCAVESCNNESTENHHVSYHKKWIEALCSEHHRDITRINAHAARRHRGSLTTKYRCYLWFQFIQGKLKKPKRSHLDKEYELLGERKYKAKEAKFEL